MADTTIMLRAHPFQDTDGLQITKLNPKPCRCSQPSNMQAATLVRARNRCCLLYGLQISKRWRLSSYEDYWRETRIWRARPTSSSAHPSIVDCLARHTPHNKRVNPSDEKVHTYGSIRYWDQRHWEKGEAPTLQNVFQQQDTNSFL